MGKRILGTMLGLAGLAGLAGGCGELPLVAIETCLNIQCETGNTGCVTEDGEPVAEIGKIIFASDHSGKAEIWTMDDDGTNLEQLTDETGYSVSPRWSPMGDKIAFLSTNGLFGNNPAQLQIMNSDGSDKTLVPSQADSYYWESLLAWKDDNSIIYEERSRPCANYLRAVDTDGTNDRLFYDGSSRQEETPDHHPFMDQTVFFRYACGGNDGGIHVVNDDGTGLEQLTANGSPDWYPRWSSDGSMIAWCKSTELWVMNADGTDQRRVGDIVGCYPDWAQDDTKLVYQGPHDGVDYASGTDIWIVKIDGSNPINLTNDKAYDTTPDWHE